MTEDDIEAFGAYLCGRSPSFAEWWRKRPEAGIGCKRDLKLELVERLRRHDLRASKDLVDAIIADNNEPRYGADWFKLISEAANCVKSQAGNTGIRYDADGNEVVDCPLCEDQGHLLVVDSRSIQKWKRGEEGCVVSAGARCTCKRGQGITGSRAAVYDAGRMMRWRDYTNLCRELRVNRSIENFGAVLHEWQDRRSKDPIAAHGGSEWNPDEWGAA